MKKIILFLFALLSFNIHAQNQEIEKLKVEFKKTKELKLKAKIAGDISWVYLHVSVDSSRFYAEKSLDIALKSKDLMTISQSYNDLANVFYINGNHKKSIELSNEAIKIKLKINDHKSLGSLYAKKANCYVKMNMYDSTMFYYTKAFKSYEKFKDTLNAINVTSNISATYFTMGNFPKAKEYLKKPIEYYNKTNNFYMLSNSILNLANVEKEMGNVDKSIETYNQSLFYAKKTSNLTTIAANYNNLSAIYLFKRNSKKALEYAIEGLKMRKKIGVESDVASSQLSVANAYLYTGEIKKAMNYYHIGKTIFEKNQLNDKLKEVYLGLSYAFAHQNKSDSLDYYYNKYQEISVIINNETFLKNSEELIVKYETEKKEKLLAEAKAENLIKEAKIKKRTTFLYSALGLAFLLGLIGFLVYKQQRLKNTQIIKENELKQALIKIENQNNLQNQRLEISKDLHDNIGSQLTFIISSLDNLKYFEFTKDKLYTKFDSIGTFTRATITDLRDTIWAMNKEAITFDDLKTRITNFIEAAKASLLGIQFEFNSSAELQNIELNSLQGIDVYRIIQEAVNNAVKHAKATKISVNFEKQNKQLLITILDNGIGFDTNKISDGNGMNSMRKRAKEIGANFEISALEIGTKISLKFDTK